MHSNMLSVYYLENHIWANPSETQKCRARTPCGNEWDQLLHGNTPKYLGLNLDRCLTYNIQMEKVRSKLVARNNIYTNWKTPSGMLI